MRHGIGNWTQKYSNSKPHMQSNYMRQIESDNYTGSFMNNYFEGFGIFTVKYKIVKKDQKPLRPNSDLVEDEMDLKPIPEDDEICDVYEGEWRNSKKHGNGTENYSNSDFYVGHFREGDYDGTGKYIW
jgi:hypothetical protein